jgi:hypothetical protein
MIIEQGDIKIALYITEESEKGYWAITNITLGYIQQAVVDLTPA